MMRWIALIAATWLCHAQEILLLTSQLNQFTYQQPIKIVTPRGDAQKFSITSRATLIIEKGDITQCQVDAIVNAANEELWGGGGVCGAIFDAAGRDQLEEACNQIQRVSPKCACPTGEVRLTSSFKLKDQGISWIIHAVGPDCRIIKDQQQQDKLLRQAYEESLKLADKEHINSIAFPFISVGFYAFPKQRAAQIAVDTIVKYLITGQSNVKEVHIVLFEKEDYDLFLSIAQKL